LAAHHFGLWAKAMEQDRFVILSDADLAGLDIAVDEIVASIEAAILAEAKGDILTTPKSALIPSDGRYMMTDRKSVV